MGGEQGLQNAGARGRQWGGQRHLTLKAPRASQRSIKSARVASGPKHEEVPPQPVLLRPCHRHTPCAIHERQEQRSEARGLPTALQPPRREEGVQVI